MRAKTRKWFNPLFVLTLAVAGLFGVTAAVVDKQLEESPVVEKADAATTNANNIYLKLIDEATNYTRWGRDPKVHIWNITISTDSSFASTQAAITQAGGTWKSGDSSADFSLTWISGGDGDDDYKYWYVEFPWYITGFDYNYFNTKPTSTGNKTGITAPYSAEDFVWGKHSYNWDSPPGTMNCSYTGTASHTKSTTTYTLSFNSNSGSSVSSQTLKEFQKTVKPSNPTKSGYVFSKWTETNSTSADAYTFGSNITADKTLYAQWINNTYTITYNVNGGSGSAPSSQTPTVGETVTFATYSGTKTGYTFGGWNTNSSGTGTTYAAGGTGTPSTAAGGTLPLYAKWNAETYTVTLDRQSGTTGSTSVTATYGSAMPSATMPTRTGYTFGGYFTETGGAGTQYYNANGTSTRNWNIDDDTTLYAKWTIKTSKLTFDLEGGSGTAPTTLTATYGSTMPTYGEAAPTKIGYAFGGFYDGDNGTGTQYYTSSLSSARNWDKNVTTGTTLYAKWTVSNFTVTKKMVLDGDVQAGNIGTDTVGNGATYAVPADRYEADCVFGGWYSNEACTTPYTATVITQNINVYAKYTTHGPWAGTINIDLCNSELADAAANYAILLMDKTTYPSELDEWSSYCSFEANVSSITIPYSVSFEPQTMVIVRYSSSYSKSDWDEQKWPGSPNAWGQTQDITFVSFLRVEHATVVEQGVSKNVTTTTPPQVNIYNSSADPEPTTIVSLSNHKTNGVNHIEYYASATFTENQQFIIFMEDSTKAQYYTSFSTHPGLSDCFVLDSNYPYHVICLQAGTYSMYFDSFTCSVYITSVAAAEADEWAQYFLANVGCDPHGINLPTGWSDCSTRFKALSNDAKDIIYDAEAGDVGYIPQAVKRYDWAITVHPSLEKFIVNSDEEVRTSAAAIRSFSPYSLFGEEEGIDSSIVLIIVASSISILSITALAVLMVKKKKTANK